MAYDPVTNSWAYSAYHEQATKALCLAMAKQFLTELNNAVTQRISGQNETWDPATINDLRQMVSSDMRILQREADAEAGVGLPTQIQTVTRDNPRYR